MTAGLGCVGCGRGRCFAQQPAELRPTLPGVTSARYPPLDTRRVQPGRGAPRATAAAARRAASRPATVVYALVFQTSTPPAYSRGESAPDAVQVMCSSAIGLMAMSLLMLLVVGGLAKAGECTVSSLASSNPCRQCSVLGIARADHEGQHRASTTVGALVLQPAVALRALWDRMPHLLRSHVPVRHSYAASAPWRLRRSGACRCGRQAEDLATALIEPLLEAEIQSSFRGSAVDYLIAEHAFVQTMPPQSPTFSPLRGMTGSQQ